jgi:CheY-like chemotaxis protein
MLSKGALSIDRGIRFGCRPVEGEPMTYNSAKGPSRALVVDDHGISRDYSVAALRQIVPAVKQAAGLREAIDLALAWLPDLLLVDIDLPDGNGLELLDRIRPRWPAGRPLPRVIVISGQPELSPEPGTLRADIDCILTKPVTLDQLKAAIDFRLAARVREETGHESAFQLRQYFLDELYECLPVLERAIADADRRGAASILHQLIASSAICGELKLEARLRALDRAVRRSEGAAAIVQAWCRVSETSGDILVRAGAGRPGPGRFRR